MQIRGEGARRRTWLGPSYAFWLKPAYYVVTDGDYFTVWNYQGGAVPDVRVIEVRLAKLREQFDELYGYSTRRRP